MDHIVPEGKVLRHGELTQSFSLGDVINKWRTEDLALESIDASMGPDLVDWLKLPVTYCWSPALVPKPQDWGSNIGKKAIFGGFYCSDINKTYVGFSCETNLYTHHPKTLRGFCAVALFRFTLDSVA